jgi:hypothetical protein
MFNFFRKKTETLLAKPQPKITTALEKEKLLQYIKHCDDIGFTPRRILDDRIALFFRERNMKVFDYEEVCAYMTSLVKNKSKDLSWAWRPLREKDKVSYDWCWKTEENFHSQWKYGYYYPNSWQCTEPYTEIIPAQVLLNVKEIEKTFGEEVSFFVTDYADPHPDPFIMVTGKQSKGIQFIFDVWDEPSFGSLEMPKEFN